MRSGDARFTPPVRGALLALLSAAAFGLTIPAMASLGRGLGSLTTAALLYAGSFASSLALSRLRRDDEAKLRREHLGRLALVALLGAGLAPTLLVWGLHRAGATASALLLNLEAAFTALWAFLLYREAIGARTAAALTVTAAGGGLLALAAGTGQGGTLGAVAVAGATAAWAMDNALSRPLAELSPSAVVAGKSAIGASLTSALALLLGEPRPSRIAVLGLLVCGAIGYGFSLQLYLGAQRRIGAARTGAIFSVAPLIGASAAWLAGDRALPLWALGAAALLALGLFLQLTERHSHLHLHAAVEHDHPHEHADGHHTHLHDPPFTGRHSHPHQHAELVHEHPHAPDAEHGHAHR